MSTRSAVREGLRFAAVGAGATVVSTVAFNALVHLPLGGRAPLADKPLTAFALANVVGMVVSYLGSRSWAFRDRRPVGVGRGLPRFVAVNVVSWIVPLTCLAFTRYVLGLDDPATDNLAANGVGLALGMLVRFWLLRSAVFVAPLHDSTALGRDLQVDDARASWTATCADT